MKITKLEKAKSKAYDLGYKAGEVDEWMVGDQKDLKDQFKEAIKEGYDKLYECQHHFEKGWLETDHFNLKWYKKLKSIKKKHNGDFQSYEGLTIHTDLLPEFWRGYWRAIEGSGRQLNMLKAFKDNTKVGVN